MLKHTQKLVIFILAFLGTHCSVHPTGAAGKRSKAGSSAAESNATSDTEESSSSTQTEETSEAANSNDQQAVPPVDACTDPVAYAETVAFQIAQFKCAACHAPGVTSPDLSTQENFASQKTSVINSIMNDTMPPGAPLSAEEKALFTQWQDATPVALKLAPSELPLTWEGQIKNFINTKCTWCHSPDAAPGDRHSPWLITYTDVVDKANSIREELNDGQMPPRNRFPQETTDEVTAFLTWNNNGRPEGTPIEYDLTPELTFDKVESLILGRCAPCHTTDGSAPKIDDEASSTLAAGLAMDAVTNDRMPPGAPLSDAEKDVFIAWYNAVGVMPTPPEVPTDPNCPAP